MRKKYANKNKNTQTQNKKGIVQKQTIQLLDEKEKKSNVQVFWDCFFVFTQKQPFRTDFDGDQNVVVVMMPMLPMKP